MKKKTVPWLLPLVAAMFLVVSADLSALSAKDEKQLTKLEDTLAKKGKLSKAQQKQYDQLKAQKDAENRQPLPPSEDLSGAAITQNPPTPIQPQVETGTVDMNGNLAASASQDSAVNLTGLVQRPADAEAGNNAAKTDLAKEDLKTGDQGNNYPDWVTNPYSLEKLIRDAIKENADGDEDAKKAASNEFNLKDVYVGIGSATNAVDSQAIQMAEARARQDLAFQQQSLVKAEITDYSKNTTSTKGGQTNDAEDYIVAQQSVNMELTPVKVQIRQYTKGAWWVVVTATKIPEHRAIVEEGPYIPSAFEAVRLMDERLERNKLKTTTASPAASEGAVRR